MAKRVTPRGTRPSLVRRALEAGKEDTWAKPVRGLLIFLGIVLIVAAGISWFVSPKVSTEETTSADRAGSVTKETNVEEFGPQATPSPSPAGQESPSPAPTKQTHTTETTTNDTPVSTKTTTTTGAARSDALILAFLGLGALFLLGGTFYGQLESLEAAGVKVNFSKATETVEALLARLTKIEDISKKQQEALDKAAVDLGRLSARVKFLEDKPNNPSLTLDEVAPEAHKEFDIASLQRMLTESGQDLADLPPLRERSERALNEWKEGIENLPGSA